MDPSSREATNGVHGAVFDARSPARLGGVDSKKWNLQIFKSSISDPQNDRPRFFSGNHEVFPCHDFAGEYQDEEGQSSCSLDLQNSDPKMSTTSLLPIGTTADSQMWKNTGAAHVTASKLVEFCNEEMILVGLLSPLAIKK